MNRFHLALTMLLLAGLGCQSPEEEASLDVEGRKQFRHCIPLHQYATVEFDTAGEVALVYYAVLQDTLKNEFIEQRIRSFRPDRQIYILGLVELSDLSRAGRGIYYVDPTAGPGLFAYEGARIVKRLRRGDSPWTIAEDLGNPDLVNAIEWGSLLPGRDFIIDLDILNVVRHRGQSFDLPNNYYTLVGTEVKKVFVKGSDERQEGQRPNERFIRQEAVMQQKDSGTVEIAFFNVFEDTMSGTQRQQHLRSVRPEEKVYLLGYEQILPDLRAMATGLYYHDPDSGAFLLDYFGARIVKRIVPGDSYGKIARDLGNAGLAGSLGRRMLHPGDTLTVNADILEAVGWSRQSFDLPNEEYWIIGRKVPTVILRTEE